MNMKEGDTVAVGDVVQIDPAHDEVFGGSFMQVTEPKPWGAQGFVVVPGHGWAFYRCKFANMARVGRAEWVDAPAPEFRPPEPEPMAIEPMGVE